MEKQALSISEIMKLDKKEQVNAVYEIFNEDSRLNRSKASRVEFLTTMRYIDKYLCDGMRILDVGAGAGAYSIELAKKGYRVDAVEFAKPNVEKFRRKIEGFEQYLNYHYYCCEKPEHLGRSNHVLYVLNKSST